MAQQFDSVDRIAHATIVTAPDQEECLALALDMAAALVCQASGPVPCGVCRSCRKAREGIHPDIIRVKRPEDDKGRPKKEIPVETVRRMAADAPVLPNESERKVYLIEDADTMNTAAQNAALKLLEEPPAGAVFLLCTVNPMLLLPTVRSRCARVSAGGETEERADEATVELAAGYLKAVSGGDAAQLFRWCTVNEGMDGKSFSALCSEVRLQLTDALCARRKLKGLSRKDMLRLCGLMEKLSQYQKVNTGVKQLFGLLAVDSIAGSEM